MSISLGTLYRSVIGNEVMTWGTYTDSGAATADSINTGIHMVSRIFLQPIGSAVVANAHVVVTSLATPADGSAISIRTNASDVGQFIAMGDSFL